ncbi:MAG: hypothetical protein GY765_26120 [bacterium]|nr:hypothetical protein [bacterium]
MKKKAALLLLLLATVPFLFPAPPVNEAKEKLELVKVISDDEEQEEYFFNYIEDAILTPCKDIIILDNHGVAVSQYDWNGNLIKRLNKKGKGPGDFLWPSIVCRTERKLYIYDDSNGRVVESDLQLGNLKYYKMPEYSIMDCFDVIGENRFVISFTNYGKPDVDKINIVGKDGKISRSFFPHTPVKLTDDTQQKRRRLSLMSIANYGINDSRTKMLVGFSVSANPIALYLYSTGGKKLREFSFSLDKKYQYPHVFIESNKLGFELYRGKYLISVQNISYYDMHWYVFVYLTHYKDIKIKYTIRNRSEYQEHSSFYLKYDAEGKLVGRFDLDSYFKCFHISKEGYVLGKHPDSEMEELVIYKIIK